jgi:hypothetical protein
MIEVVSSQRGLGAYLTVLSLLLDLKKPVNIRTAGWAYEDLTEIQKVFNLPSRLTITQDKHTPSGEEFLDFSKLFSPYFEVDSLNLFGQNTLMSKHKKPCIGLACYTHNIPAYTSNQTINKNQFPYNKCYPIEQYGHIFNLIKLAGYDVITLDAREIKLEEKVFMMTTLCDAVIGYEGGICHLAHILGIPTLLIPWHSLPEWHSFKNTELENHLAHLDTKTYFLKSIKELLDFTPDLLNQKIEELKDNKGNNIILNSSIAMSPALDKIEVNGDIYPTRGLFSSKEIRFFQNNWILYNKEFKIAGTNPIRITNL